MRRLPVWILLAGLPLGACRVMSNEPAPNASSPDPDPPREAAGEGADSTELRDFEVRNGEEAMELLLDGNARFAAGRPHHDHESQRRRAMLTSGQHPFAVVLGCADSRVPPELIFDAGLGDLFVIRVAGNVVETDEAGSIEYAVDHLEAKLILVLGHEGCGAVTAALEATTREAPELRRLLAAVELGEAATAEDLDHEERVHRGVEANVRESVRRLRTIGQREGQRDVIVAGAVYELESGRVRALE